jgi:hypothetical protein
MSHSQLFDFAIPMTHTAINKLCAQHFNESHENIIANAELSLEADHDTEVLNIPKTDKVVYALKRALLCTILEKPNNQQSAKNSKKRKTAK